MERSEGGNLLYLAVKTAKEMHEVCQERTWMQAKVTFVNLSIRTSQLG